MTTETTTTTETTEEKPTEEQKRQDPRIADLEKDNTELKDRVDNLTVMVYNLAEQLDTIAYASIGSLTDGMAQAYNAQSIARTVKQRMILTPKQMEIVNKSKQGQIQQ